MATKAILCQFINITNLLVESFGLQILTIHHSLLAIRHSLLAAVFTKSYMADTRVCPYHSPFATRHSPPFSPVVAVLATRYWLLATHHPCDFFFPLRIQLMQQLTGFVD
ncbi:hypothetical protein [Fervidibacter sp.]